MKVFTAAPIRREKSIQYVSKDPGLWTITHKTDFTHMAAFINLVSGLAVYIVSVQLKWTLAYRECYQNLSRFSQLYKHYEHFTNVLQTLAQKRYAYS